MIIIVLPISFCKYAFIYKGQSYAFGTMSLVWRDCENSVTHSASSVILVV